jgi:hypothetical protein
MAVTFLLVDDCKCDDGRRQSRRGQIDDETDQASFTMRSVALVAIKW